MFWFIKITPIKKISKRWLNDTRWYKNLMEWPSLFKPDTQVQCISKKPPLFKEHVFFWSLSLPLPPLSVLWLSQCAWALSDHPFSFMTEISADYGAPCVWHPYFCMGCMAFRRCNKRRVVFFLAAGLAEGTCEVKGGVDIAGGQLLHMVKLKERETELTKKKKKRYAGGSDEWSCSTVCWNVLR